MISGIDSFPLLAGHSSSCRQSDEQRRHHQPRIYDFALALVGWLKGGLGHVNIIGSVTSPACRDGDRRYRRSRHHRDQR
jgi:TRAP-type C4-dicarboxylate transport system permease large subunit